jgi:hypothetical protein
MDHRPVPLTTRVRQAKHSSLRMQRGSNFPQESWITNLAPSSIEEAGNSSDMEKETASELSLEEPSPHPRRRQPETPLPRRQDPQSPIGLDNLSRSTRISRDIYIGYLPPCSPCPPELKRQPEGIGNGGAGKALPSFHLLSTVPRGKGKRGTYVGVVLVGL